MLSIQHEKQQLQQQVDSQSHRSSSEHVRFGRSANSNEVLEKFRRQLSKKDELLVCAARIALMILGKFRN